MIVAFAKYLVPWLGFTYRCPLFISPEREAIPIGSREKVRLVGGGFEATASVVQATRQAGVVGYNAGGVVARAEEFGGQEPVTILADRDKLHVFQGRDVGETGQKAGAKATALIEVRNGTALYLEPPARISGGLKGADWADALRPPGWPQRGAPGAR